MSSDFALKEIQLRLGVPQHVLIHLCEKGVITPEVSDTEGRGMWRKFSTRNLFEFAVALELRRYQIPVIVVGAIIKLLGSFERAVQRSIGGFQLPESLSGSAPELILSIYDGEQLVFGLGKKTVFAFNPAKTIQGSQSKVEKLSRLPTDYKSYLTINLTELAKEISRK